MTLTSGDLIDIPQAGLSTARPTLQPLTAADSDEPGAAVFEYGLSTLSLPAVWALIDPRNSAGTTVAERLGFGARREPELGVWRPTLAWGGAMSFRPANTFVPIAVCALAFALAGCGTQATDPVRFSRVMVVSRDATSIQLSADMCHAQPYKTVVAESADLVSIQLLGTATDGNPAPSCADLVEVQLASPLSSRRVHDATAGADVPVWSSLRR